MGTVIYLVTGIHLCSPIKTLDKVEIIPVFEVNLLTLCLLFSVHASNIAQ